MSCLMTATQDLAAYLPATSLFIFKIKKELFTDSANYALYDGRTPFLLATNKSVWRDEVRAIR